MKKNSIVGVWNHECQREDPGLIISIKEVKNSQNYQMDRKYLVMIEGAVYELYDFQVFEPGKAEQNVSLFSLGKCFFSAQGKYERIQLQ
jgi:hypothetical protein